MTESSVVSPDTQTAYGNFVLGMLPLVAANGLTVSSLYWAQSVVGQATAELGLSALILAAPGVALLGYALGVAALATLSRDLASRGGLARHGMFLAAALFLAATAPNSACLALACVAVGGGCALTQRLLVIATTLVPPDRQPQAIGTIISAGLLGITVARSFITEIATALGWRHLFLADAIAISAACLMAAWLSPRHGIVLALNPALPSPVKLLREMPTFRKAALQQAIAFAAFNMGWSVFPAFTHASSAVRAMIAATGACAALACGRACRRWAPNVVARAGLFAAGAAVSLVALIFVTKLPASSTPVYVAMLLLEVGTQVALVANQAQAQAAASTVPVRGRLAAIVTTIAFTGGAVGAALGNLLQR